MRIIEIINVIFGGASALLLTAGGLYFCRKTKLLRPSGFRRIFGETLGKRGKGATGFRAFSASLAGAAGIGNIVGTASAIAAGGAGAIFWMWTAAFLGMAVKYAEIRIHSAERESGRFAAMKTISSAAGKPGAIIFSSAGIITALCMGNMIQCRALSESLSELAGIPNLATGIAAAFAIGFMISGGAQRLTERLEKAVPLMTLLYVTGGVVLMCVYREHIFAALYSIATEAVGFRPAAGGFAGAFIANSIKEGFVKGIFSNEAGLGSAALSYSVDSGLYRKETAYWGALDVFADTIVISSVTAFVILLTGRESVCGAFGDCFGVTGKIFTVVITALFALTAATAWEYYGEICFSYLFGKIPAEIFRAIFLSAAIIGSCADTLTLWKLAEISNSVMMLSNMTAVFAKRKLADTT